MITPVPEKMYLRLYALYSKMVNQRQHYAGLNPRGFRQADLRQRPVIPAGPPGPKVILDGNLIFEFTQLSIRQREELARSIGSNVDVLMDDLLELITGIEFY